MQPEDDNYNTSSATKAIADGIRNGQRLLLICGSIASGSMPNPPIILNGANTELCGNFQLPEANDVSVLSSPAYLDLVWSTGRGWLEIGRSSSVSCVASGFASHAEGNNTTASGIASHAEGSNTIASGDDGAHAEGAYATASGVTSHAEGTRSVASLNYESAHASGRFTSNGDCQNSKLHLRKQQSHTTTGWAVS